MKPLKVFTVCVAAALIIASVVLNVWQSRERARLEDGIVALKQQGLRPDGTARHEPKAPPMAHESRQAASRGPQPDPHQMAGSITAVALPTPPAANAAIIGYLGDPVPPPANLDSRYTAEGVLAAFKTLCDSRGIKVEKLGVDRSEFPFLVYGVLDGGRDFFREIDSELRSMPGYSYSGSVVGSLKNGSTYFSLNMIPSSELPRDHSEAIRRRLMVRLQMLGVIWSDPEPPRYAK